MVDRRSTALMLLALMFTIACDDEDSPTNPIPEEPAAGAVFAEGYAEGVTFQAFAGSKLDAVTVDETVAYQGSSSLKITVPAPDATGTYAGGAFTASTPWDLTQYNVLSFWARADRNATLDVAGLGNDNSGASLYMVETTEMEVSGVWRKYMVPMPDPEMLDAEAGLFYFAEGAENGEGYTIWLDNVQFESVEAELVRASMANRTLTLEPGTGTDKVTGLSATVSIGGADYTVSPMANYFSFTSSDPTVAAVAADGTITAGVEGVAVITAKLGELEVGGSVTVTAGTPLTQPAPTPTRPAADVISLFSNAYTDVTVDTWSASWDNADVEDKKVAGDDVKLYTNLTFAGIEFTSQTIDATAMDGFHMDIWTPDPSASPAVFKIKLVDFGADGAWSGGDDVEHEISVVAPTLKSKEWVSIDVPLSDFTGMTTRAHVAQLIISGTPNTVHVDNIYFFKGEAQGGGGDPPPPPEGPSTAAPTPTQDAANVISLFSNAYTDATVDTWSPDWDQADLEDVQVAGDDVKKYTNLVYAVIDWSASGTFDATSMTHFRMDIWTPDPTADPAAFKVKLVDFGADGAYQGGDDVEDEIAVTAASTPPLATGQWISLDIPLSDFTALTTRANMAQLVISGDPNTVFVDNVYFYDASAAPPTEPSTAAPTPTQDAGKVISLFSNAYTNVTVDTWSPDWDAADLADVQVAGDDVKKYTNLGYAVIDWSASGTFDATAMTNFRMDIWTPDPTADPAAFKVKLVDFGADDAYQGGDDVEYEIAITAASTPPLATGQWISLDIPLSEFTGLTTRANMAQLVISGDPNTVFVDNVYFYEDTPAATEPTTAAPTPTVAEADVISLFSNAYTDVTVDTWSPDWDQADLEDVQVAGDDVKKYTNLVYAVIDWSASGTFDATSMTHFHIDIWTPDPTADPAAFKVKLVDFGADGAYQGGDDVEDEIAVTAASTPALATGQWISLDIPLSDFTALTTRANMAQLVISGDPNTVFVDNVYFRK